MRKKFGPRGPRGNRVDGRSAFDPLMKPFDQHVLTNKELAILDKLFNKIHNAKVRFHKAGKCRIENEGIWPCEGRIDLETGNVHHYPNGYYV